MVWNTECVETFVVSQEKCGFHKTKHDNTEHPNTVTYT